MLNFLASCEYFGSRQPVFELERNEKKLIGWGEGEGGEGRDKKKGK